MKTRIVLLLSLVLTSLNSFSQITTCYYEEDNVPDSIQKKISQIISSQIQIQPPSDIQKLLSEDLLRSYNAPARFGKGIDVSFSIEDGTWTDVENGRVWSCSFKSEGAKSLNFIFNSLILPPGGNLEIVNDDGSIFYGPVTQKDIPHNGMFLTDVINGDIVTMYLFEPSAYYGKSSLKISRIIYGYREINGCNGTGIIGASSPCNIDVACRPAYLEDSYAVAMVITGGGTAYGSGALVMTTDNSFKPYFLSAFHNVDIDLDGQLSQDEINLASQWYFKFWYRKETCGGSTTIGSMGYWGSILRAAWKQTDFALLEINSLTNNPVDNPYLRWLGWDRTGNIPTGGACLHHPCGDVMKISTSNNVFITDKYMNQGDYNHWKVIFDENDGIVQAMSSGAPILNQNHRVVGHLHGGHTEGDPCDWNEGWYGKFSESWTGGGSNDNRLSNWLDSIGTNQQTTNTSSPLSLLSISGPIVPQAYSTYSVNNPYSGCVIAWRYSGTPLVWGNDTTTIGQQFVISNSMKQYMRGTLTATIYRDGAILTTLSKPIRSGGNFNGTFSQEGGPVNVNLGYVDYYDPIPPTDFHDGETVTVHRQHMVTMQSPKFVNCTLTPVNGSLPTIWNHNGNTITFKSPSTNSEYQVTLQGVLNNSYDVFRFKIRKPLESNLPPNNPYFLNIQSNNGYMFIELAEKTQIEFRADNSESHLQPDSSTVVYLTEEEIEGLEWNVHVANAKTGKCEYEGRVRGLSASVPIKEWEPGVYAISATIGKQQLSNKIIINK